MSLTKLLSLIRFDQHQIICDDKKTPGDDLAASVHVPAAKNLLKTGAEETYLSGLAFGLAKTAGLTRL